MKYNNTETILNIEEDSFNFKKEFSYYLFFWPWFLLTMILSIIGSYIYLRYTPNIYSSSAQVQITKSDASSSFLTTEVTSLFGTRINVENDISVITSNYILDKVVKRLDLQTSVTEIGRVKSSLKFGEEIPFEIKFKKHNKFQNWNLLFSEDYAVISNDLYSFNLHKNKIFETDEFSIKIKDSISLINKNYQINSFF